MNSEQIRRYVDAAFRAHEAKLRAYIRTRLNAQQKYADDVFSVTFERLIKALERAVAQNKSDNFLLMTAQRERPESARAGNALRAVATFVIKDVFRKVGNEPMQPNPRPDSDDDDITIPKSDENLPGGLTDPEASETYRRILEEIFRQTTRAFEKAVLIGMAYNTDDDEIAARFGRSRMHVQRTRSLLRKRYQEIARKMLEE